MIRRIVALALWTYFAWYLGAVLSAITGGPAVAGPIAGALTAAVAAVGWVRIARRQSMGTAAQGSLEPAPSR